MRYKLIVSDELHFNVPFTLADGAAERLFTAKLSARRCPGAELDDKLSQAGRKVADFLREQGLTLRGWDGDCPLVDEDGQAAKPGADSLADLLAIPNMPNLVMSHYLVANGAKGKLGN